MNRHIFEKLKILCELNPDKKYVNHCIEVIRNEECIFESGIIMSHDHIANLYSLRFNIAKESAKLNAEYLKDYESCVANLNKSKSEFLGITSVYNDNNSL